MSTVLTPAEKLAEAMAKLTAERESQAIEKQIASLGTETGANRALAKADKEILIAIKQSIEKVTDKPLFTGYTYHSNVELIVAIAGALQYMKGELREQINSGYWLVFDEETRSGLIEAYGNLPYHKEPTLIEVNNDETIEIDPESVVRAANGTKPDLQTLQEILDAVAIDLGLLATMTVTQKQADNAWIQAESKLTKQKVLAEYANSLDD